MIICCISPEAVTFAGVGFEVNNRIANHGCVVLSSIVWAGRIVGSREEGKLHLVNRLNWDQIRDDIACSIVRCPLLQSFLLAVVGPVEVVMNRVGLSVGSLEVDASCHVEVLADCLLVSLPVWSLDGVDS